MQNNKIDSIISSLNKVIDEFNEIIRLNNRFSINEDNLLDSGNDYILLIEKRDKIILICKKLNEEVNVAINLNNLQDNKQILELKNSINSLLEVVSTSNDELTDKINKINSLMRVDLKRINSGKNVRNAYLNVIESEGFRFNKQN